MANELMIPAAEIAPAVQQMREGMTALAEMLRVTNERMQALEAAVRTLEKVTPGQATCINKEIRNRAAEICGDWMMDGMEQKIAGEIRKTVRTMTGAQTAREIARCDYGSVMEMIDGWEDYDLIQKIRKGVK